MAYDDVGAARFPPAGPGPVPGVVPGTVPAAPLSQVRPRLAEGDLGMQIVLSRLLLVSGLVFIHYGAFPGEVLNHFQAFDRTGVPAASFVASAILYFFFAAVPVMSLISGWLFFRPRDPAARQPGLAGLVEPGLTSAMLRRARTLLVPLLLWNALALGVGILAWQLGAGAWARQVLALDVAEASPLQWLNALLGLTRTPAALQFWFVRDLLVSVALAPLVLPLLRHAPWVLVPFALVWMSGIELGIFLRADVPLFFFLGGVLRLHGMPGWLERVPVVPMLAAYTGLVLLRTSAPAVLDELDPTVDFWLDAATCCLRVIGVVTCWKLLGLLAAHRSGAVLAGRYGAFAFFIFAGHYPLVEAVKVPLAAMLPTYGQGWLLLHFGLSVAVTVAICVGAAALLSRAWPAAFQVLNGGRGA
ncbi:MAG TPA: acyltransferase family protein [Azospirillaceae bacterium]|nr:acyltransferase family protein [Azospirillaceae bacterium]